MLSKEKRLNIKKVFSWIRSGRRLEDGLVRVFYKFGDNEKPRLGIAVSSKVFKKAVQRNRARRLISRGFEQLYEKLPEKINILAIPKEKVLDLKSDEVKEDLEELLEKEGII